MIRKNKGERKDRGEMDAGLFIALAFMLIIFCFMLGGVFSLFADLEEKAKITASTTPAPPEAKIGPASPVLDKALERKSGVDAKKISQNILKRIELEKQFAEQGIKVFVSSYVEFSNALAFFEELKLDEESKDIFRKFSEAGITIFIGNDYDVRYGNVWIDARDGVKKTAKWLATGKI